MLDLVDAIRPPYVLIENVKGFLAPKHSETKEWVFGRLASSGYAVRAGLYDAADFGVPQHRRRILIVGSLSGAVPLMQPTHGPTEGLKPWLTLADAIQDVEPGPHAEFRPSMVKYLGMLKPGQNWRQLPLDMQHDALGGAFTSKASKAGAGTRTTAGYLGTSPVPRCSPARRRRPPRCATRTVSVRCPSLSTPPYSSSRQIGYSRVAWPANTDKSATQCQ